MHIPICTSLPLSCCQLCCSARGGTQAAYLGENVVSENEYLSAIAPNSARDYVGMRVVWIVQRIGRIDCNVDAQAGSRGALSGLMLQAR